MTFETNQILIVKKKTRLKITSIKVKSLLRKYSSVTIYSNSQLKKQNHCYIKLYDADSEKKELENSTTPIYVKTIIK